MTITVQPQTVTASTLFMIDMFSDLDMTGVPVAFSSFFGRAGVGRRTFVDNSLMCSIDLVRGESTISKMFTRQTGASMDLGEDTKSLKGQRFKTETRVFPIMSEQMHIGYDDLFNRVPGELPYNSDMTTIERLRIRFAEQIKEAIKKLMRRNELACSESLRTGKQTLDDDAVYDFDRSSTNTFASPLPFNDENALIINYIDDICDRVQENGKVEPDFILIGTGGWGAMVKQPIFSKTADNWGYMFIRAGQSMILPSLSQSVQWMLTIGFKYVGFIKTYKGRELPIFTYNEKYQDSLGSWKSYMPEDELLVGWSGARCDSAFGPRITFPNNPFHDQAMNALLGFDFMTAPMPMNLANTGVFDPRMFHIDGSVNRDNDAISARIVTGGIFSTTRTDSFGLITEIV